MNKLRLIRVERGLSQFELAAASEVPRYSIQLAETGIRLPSPGHQIQLAEALGTSVDELFGSAKEAKPSTGKRGKAHD